MLRCVCWLLSAASGRHFVQIEQIARMKLPADRHLKCLFLRERERERALQVQSRQRTNAVPCPVVSLQIFSNEKTLNSARAGEQRRFCTCRTILSGKLFRTFFLFSNCAFNLHRSMFAEKSRRTLCRLHRRAHIAVHCVATSERESLKSELFNFNLLVVRRLLRSAFGNRLSLFKRFCFQIIFNYSKVTR